MGTEVKIEGPTAGFEDALKAKGVPEHIATVLRGELTKYANVTRYGYATPPSTATSLAVRNAYGIDIGGTQAGMDVITVVGTYMRKVYA